MAGAPASEQPPVDTSPFVYIKEELIAMLPDNSGVVDLNCTLCVQSIFTGVDESEDPRYTTGRTILLTLGTTTQEFPEHTFRIILAKLRGLPI